MEISNHVELDEATNIPLQPVNPHRLHANSEPRMLAHQAQSIFPDEYPKLGANVVGACPIDAAAVMNPQPGANHEHRQDRRYPYSGSLAGEYEQRYEATESEANQRGAGLGRNQSG